MAAPAEVLNHVYQSLRDLPPGTVYPKAAGLARHYGVTVQTVYRWAARRGLHWRSERSTKGATRVPDDALIKASKLLAACRRTTNQITMCACDAKEVLEDSGIDTGGVSTSWFLAKLRQRAASARHITRPAPHVRLLSEHPNHVWQFDVTNCIQYFLDDHKGRPCALGERDPDMELYKNKIVRTARGIRKELLRYAAVDHCSGAFYFRYFYTSGERAIDGSTFLFEAMRPKDALIARHFPEKADRLRGVYPFHGVPFMLVADRGSIATAKANQALFDALRAELVTHLPGNPRAKGAIEGLMHITNRFEALLKVQRPASLDQLNGWALDWSIKYNGTKLMRDIAPRSAFWSTITKEQLRICPDEEVYRLLVREPTFTRTADGAGYISVDNRSYHIPDPNAAYQKVTVVRHPYEHPAVEAHVNGHVWLCAPVGRERYGRLADGVPYGQHRAPRQTDAQRAKTEAEKAAPEWGITYKGTGDHRRAISPPVGHQSPLKVFGHQAEKVGNVGFVPRPGTPLDIRHPEAPANDPITVDAPAPSHTIIEREIPIAEFLRRLVQRAGRITPAQNREIRERYGASIAVTEAEEIIRGHEEQAYQPACAGPHPHAGALPVRSSQERR